MNLDTIEGVDDAALLNDPEIAEILTTRRRGRPLRFAQVRKLVEWLQMGHKRHANLEANGTGHWGRWKLRFSLRDDKGGIKRKSIVIDDALVADWVRDYLAQARKERSAYRAELQKQESRKRWAANPFRLRGSLLSLRAGESGHEGAASARASEDKCRYPRRRNGF